MIDYANINCYDFEKLIGSLFQKMGFEVEVTQSSGDGGVDVIAYYNNPVFKGKYLVQCKHWNQQVGQPEIRDLYGTVMHDKAIKGILITTSTFTDQALSFANDVGIECIDGKILYDLLQKYNFDINPQNIQTQKIFYEYENFNRVKYEYLKENVAENIRDINAYRELFNFLLSYISNDNIKMLYSGLLEEGIKAGNEYIKRHKKSKEWNLNFYGIEIILLYLLHGDILKAYEEVKRIKTPILIIEKDYNYIESEMEYNFILLLSKFPQYKDFDFLYEQYLSLSRIDECCKRSSCDCLGNTFNDSSTQYTKELSISIKNGTADELLFGERILSYHLIRPYIENNPQVHSELAKLEQIIS